MGSHPANLTLRFILEIVGLFALAWFGWRYGKGVFKYVLAIGLPVLAVTLWGVFAVPDDPSRSGEAVVAIPGIMRLLLELVFFGAATWSLCAVGAATYGWIYATVVLAHYAVSYDRILWLIQQ